jgi:hypothetical protein
VVGIELAHAAAAQLRARLPAATGGQLAAAIAVGCALPGGGVTTGAHGSAGSGGGLVRSAAKLLLARAGECEAAELLWSAGALARSGAAGGSSAAAAGLDATLMIAALLAQAAGHDAAAPGLQSELRRAQRALARLQQRPPASDAASAWNELCTALAAAQAACMAAPEAAHPSDSNAGRGAQQHGQEQPLVMAPLHRINGATAVPLASAAPAPESKVSA